ncbi:hypothetical protein DNH61_08100 [Paenibacillus sambharensis]|uniref:Sugar ABC transporter substrate-binding protein n=1 Tax=Paenibacillus sambharensis TaxID=1803190 RepID=A0A2W1LY65_9BACL|nr:extracellular solute-binding protein [Paenibacillus sambharensis]PZD96457.1 hypothetical protein DNH61_08100 [Paenibacillus sambharensis]
MFKVAQIITAATLVLTLLGCANTPEVEDRDYSGQIIRIYTPDVEQFFYRNYGNFILDQFPGLEIDLIVANDQLKGEERMKEILDASPDLVVSYLPDFDDMARESHLTDLRTLLGEDEFDPSLYADDMIRLMSREGSLYGLSPRVNVFGIFYNKDLLDRKSVSYPTAGMTWHEFLQTLAYLDDGELVAFETNSSPSHLLMGIASTNQWTIIDYRNQEVVLNKSDWLEAIDRIVSLYQSKAIVSLGGNAGKLFLEGKSLFTDAPLSLVDKLNEAQEPIEWGFIPEPVGEENRSESRSVYADRVFSIPVQSENKELSSEIIEAVMSEDGAIYIDGSHTVPNVSTLETHNNDYHGANLELFWQQSMSVPQSILSKTTFSEKFIEEFYVGLEGYLQAAIRNEITPEECYTSIEELVRTAYEKEIQGRN